MTPTSLPPTKGDVRETIAHLERTRRQFQQAIADIDQLLLALRELPPLWGAAQIRLDLSRVPGSQSSPLKTSPDSPPHQGTRRSVIRPAVTDVLRARAPELVHADEVLASLQARGIPLSQKDPKATVVTAMIRMDRERRTANQNEGVEKLPGNFFRWTAPGSTTDTSPQLSASPDTESP